MTIVLPITDNLTDLRNAVYEQLKAQGHPDLAQEAMTMADRARDADEYARLILGLSAALEFDWRDA